MEDVGTFYVHLVNFPAIWHILWQFGIFYPVLVHFYQFWYVVSRKIWQPCIIPLGMFSFIEDIRINRRRLIFGIIFCPL
jgi:hypothetical protein